MAGDASGDRREGDDGTRERQTTGSTDERTTVRNVRDSADVAPAADDDRIPIDLSSDDDGAGADDATETEDDEDTYAPEPSSTPIHPGTPSLESAVFVLLGAVAMLLVIARVVSLVF